MKAKSRFDKKIGYIGLRNDFTIISLHKFVLK